MIAVFPLLALSSLVSLPQSVLGRLELFVNQYTPKKWSPYIIGSLILMIAFLGSAFIMGYGAQYFGWDIFRVRTTISVGFFLFCLVAAILYYNIAKRVPGAAELR
jgi:hypothetical protein